MPPKKKPTKPVPARDAGTMSFREFWDGPLTQCGWVAEDTWRIWKILCIAVMGEPLTNAEQAIYEQFTGGRTAPTRAMKQAWILVGRRGGKNWIAAAIAVYIALYRPPTLKRGTLGRVLCLAVDRDQAAIAFGYIRNLIGQLGEDAMIQRETQDTLELVNGLTIEVKTTSYRSLRGTTTVAVIADEVASWWNDETSANPDMEIFRALRPSMWGVEGSLLFVISSPYARKGSLWEAYRDFYGKDDARVLVWRARTLDMRPTTDPDLLADLADEKAKDPVSYAAEFDAQFRDDVKSFVTAAELDAVTVDGAQQEPRDGMKLIAYADMAGGAGADSAAVAIAGELPDKRVALLRVEEWRPKFNSVEVVQEMAALLVEHGIDTVTMDRFGGDTYVGIFRVHAPGIHVRIAERTTTENYSNFVPLLTGQKIQLLNHDRLRGQFLGLERKALSNGRETIDHSRNGHDDVACAAAGALVLGAELWKGFDPFSWTSGWRSGPQGRVSVAPPAAAAAPRVHDVNDAGHRVECRQCRNAWKASTPGTDGWITGPNGERYRDARYS